MKLLSLDGEFRGPAIMMGIYTDDLVTEIISYHFCPDESRRQEFVSFILNSRQVEMSFSDRIEILQSILKKDYQNLIKKYPDLIKNLGKIRKFRNQFAHQLPDLFKVLAEKPKALTLVYYENGVKKEKDVTQQELTHLVVTSYFTTQNLQAIKKYIKRHRKSRLGRRNAKQQSA
jgi:hypothetical protein